MKFLARHDTLIAIIGIAILTMGYFWGVISPGRTLASRIEAEIALSQEKESQIPLILAERSHLQKRLELEREQFKKIEVALPDDSHVSDVLHQIASQARQAGLVIARLEPLPTIEYASYAAHPFHLSCRGTFEDTAEFLKALESQPRLITFGNVNLTRGNEQSPLDEGPNKIQANIDFSVYSRNSKSTKLAENTSRGPSAASDN